MMRCRTPFEMLDEQNKLLQSVFADFQEVSARDKHCALCVPWSAAHEGQEAGAGGQVRISN
jgi:hypothetical protein